LSAVKSKLQYVKKSWICCTTLSTSCTTNAS